ncbi:MAG: SH3-like domain-containing protein [Bacteroidales bacterium]|nr:SH3-like domain-containing protein [Bacteroidales bacterium]
MMNLKYLLMAGLILLVAGCNNNSTGDFTNVTVKEVEQVAGYTYLLVKNKGPEYWVAVPTMNANPGDTYHYQGGMLMEDFHSKELDRTFEKVIFLETLFTGKEGTTQAVQEMTPGSSTIIEKSEVVVKAGEGTVAISDLYADPGSFEGKVVRVKGEVTKFNPAIMERNWVHVQDGTEHEGKFDLTATSIESFEVGSIVILEGVLAVNRDFGYGYSYEILLETATAVE